MTTAETSPLYEKTLTQNVIYEGRVVTMRSDTALHPSGAECVREVVMHPGGVVVCPILPDGRLVFVEQWRYPLGRTLLELPAGKLERGEDPDDAISRELFEETGYEADTWTKLTYMYTAPGFCDEKLWLYKATDLKNGHKLHEPSDTEWLNVHLLTPEDAWARVRSGDIVDAKTMVLLALCTNPSA